ncbi:MAG: CARDB domain-containing protein [Dehalococcoidales bacterium]|nr:CARDB domain-containing protein [Dehalococcoidales bacterium]
MKILLRLLVPIILVLLTAPYWSTVARAAEPASRPDLIVDRITISPADPTIRDRLTFTVTVKNIGTERAELSKVDYFIDSEHIDSAEIDSLAPGVSTTLTTTWKPQAGDHTIRAIADARQAISENDEADNDLTLSFSVRAPNLVSEIAWLPQNPAINDDVIISVITKNRGNTTAGNSYLEFFIDGVSRGYVEVPRLEAGLSTASTFTLVARPGTHQIKTATDVLNQVAEGNEQDNIETAVFATLAADLVVNSITWTPVCPVAGDNVTFTVTVKNTGDGISVPSHLACRVDNNGLSPVPVPALAPAAVFRHTFSWIAEAGSHSVSAVADSDRENDESDETNNEKTETLTEPVPDLIIQSVTWAPSRPTAGESVTCNVTLQNQGYGACGVSVVYLMVDTMRYSALVEGMRGGGTAWTVFTWAAREGSQVLTMIADAEDNIIEANESNNTRTVSLTSANSLPPPDLVVKNVAWSPDNPAVGDAVVLTGNIKNEGGSQATASTCAIYIDGKAIASILIESLDAGATATISCPWEATPGEHLVSFIADFERSINETNENNTYVKHFSVRAPDLVIKDISWTPANPAPGEEMTLTLTVTNRGNYRSGDFFLGCFIAGALRGNLYVEALEPEGVAVKTISMATPSIPCTIKVIADLQKEVAELDETNNEKATEFTGEVLNTDTAKEEDADQQTENVTAVVPPVMPPPAPTPQPAPETTPTVPPEAPPKTTVVPAKTPLPKTAVPEKAKSAEEKVQTAKEVSSWQLLWGKVRSMPWLMGVAISTVIIAVLALWLISRNHKAKSQPVPTSPQSATG